MILEPVPAEVWEIIRGAVLPYAVSFRVQGEPAPKKRRVGQGNRAFTPRETVEAEKAVRAAFRTALPDWEAEPDATYGVMIEFHTKLSSKVDLDNATKLIWDALNKTFWQDDIQVGVAFLYLDRGQDSPGFTAHLFRAADNGTPKTKICPQCSGRYRAQARLCASCLKNRAAVRELLADPVDDDGGRLQRTAFAFVVGQLAAGRQPTAAQLAVRLCTSEPRARAEIQALIAAGYLAREGRNLTVIRPLEEVR